MKKLFSNDTFLKIFSIVAAILCWVWVVFITNPDLEVTITDIPLTLSDHQSIKSEGYIVSNEIDSTVDITLRGSRKMLASVNKDNVIAYVDLSGCTSKASYKLPVTIKLPYDELKIVSKSVYNVSVSVDKIMSRNFEIETVFSGSPRKDSYSVNSTELKTDVVKVVGPEELVKTIEKACVTIDVNGVTKDVSGDADVLLYNSNDSVISSSAITLSESKISYICEIYMRKTLNVNPSVSGDSSVKATVTDHPTITLVGPVADVEKIKEVTTQPISINESALPESYNTNLIIPKKIQVVDDITTVNVLVEKHND